MNIHLIGKNEIDSADVSRIKAATLECINAYRKDRPLVPVSFGISCYDDDPRALFDIEEVRTWATAVLDAVPFLFSIVTADTTAWLFPAVAPIEIVERTAHTTGFKAGSGIEEFLAKINMGINSLCQTLASSQEEFDRLYKERQTDFVAGLKLAGIAK